jgi:hypothetical protein
MKGALIILFILNVGVLYSIDCKTLSNEEAFEVLNFRRR